MNRKLTSTLAAALLLATAIVPARATTIDNDHFTCVGTVKHTASGSYEISEDVADDSDYVPMVCMLDDVPKPVIQRIIRTCRGYSCVVQAIGTSGNGNRHQVEKVISIGHSD